VSRVKIRGGQRLHRGCSPGAHATNCSTTVRSRPNGGADTFTELRKRAAETEAKLKGLYDVIEIGVVNMADPSLKDCVAEPAGSGHRRC
jgi:hypothetical protein